MNITVNGRDLELPTAVTVAQLIERLGLETPYALVERNGEPVERTRYSKVELAEGDRLVVARPTAGG